MVLKAEYDYMKYISFPSSAKVINDGTGPSPWVYWSPHRIAVQPRDVIRVTVEAKQENVKGRQGHVLLLGIPGALGVMLPLGSFDWSKFEREVTIPPEVNTFGVMPAGGDGTTESPGITWFDDLKIYQNEKLIYENKFTAPLVQAAVGVVLPIATGLGVVRFGKKG